MELPTDASSPTPLPPPPPTPPPAGPLPPPPMAASPRQHAARVPVAGELTTGWRVATALVWAGVFVAWIAVWKTSTELGMTTWWLGPLGDPMPAVVRMLPYVPPTLMAVIALNNVRFVPHAGLAASAVLAAIAAADLAKVPRIALVELAIAFAGLLVSIAGFSGRYRTPTDPVPHRPTIPAPRQPAQSSLPPPDDPGTPPPTRPRFEARSRVDGPGAGPPTLR